MKSLTFRLFGSSPAGQGLSRSIPPDGIAWSMVAVAAVVLMRLPFLSDAVVIWPTGNTAIQALRGSPFLSGVLRAVALGIGCAMLGRAFSLQGIREAFALGIALSLLPVIYLNGVMSSSQVLSVSCSFVSFYFFTVRKPVFAALLMALAILLSSPMVLVLFLVIPPALASSDEGAALRRSALLVLIILGVGVLMELVLSGGIHHGLAFDRLPAMYLVRLILVYGYGVPALVAFVVILGTLIVKQVWSHMVSHDVAWYLAGAGVGGVGALLLRPHEILLFLTALFLLVTSARALPRTLNWAVLLLVAASSFFCMVSSIPVESILFSGSSSTVNVGTRRIYVDLLQGPVLFEHAKARAVREAGLLLATASAQPAEGGTESKDGQMWVTGYYPVWSLGMTNGGLNNPMYPHEMKWRGLTHVVHFNVGPDSTPPFWHPSTSHTMGMANPDSMEMFFGFGWRNNTTYHMIDSLREYAHANGVKLLLSVGGIWGAQAGAMNYITGDSLRTQRFTGAAVAFAFRNGYDGVEIDYEPPASEEQMSRLTRIMKRTMTQILGGTAPLVLAACVDCCRAYAFDLQDSVAQYNFMMYDMHQPYNGISRGGPADPLDVTGYNAPLFPPAKEEYPVLNYWGQNYDGTRAGVPEALGPKRFLRLGFSAGKIGMGVPFYGYIYAGTDGPNQPRGGVWPQYVSYADCRKALTVGGARHWDQNAKVPWMGGTASLGIGWMVKPGQKFYITYDDTISLREKVLWAKKLGLGGIMVYELWNGWISDAPDGERDPLLRSVVNAIARN